MVKAYRVSVCVNQSVFGEFSLTNQLDCLHSQSLLPSCSLILEPLRQAATDVKALDGNPITFAVFCALHGCQSLVVDNIVADDVFLDLAGETGNDTFGVSTRGDEDEATVGIFSLIDQIVESDNAPISHRPRHVELLQHAFMTIDVRTFNHSLISIAHFAEVLGQVFSIVTMALKSEPRDPRSL